MLPEPTSAQSIGWLLLACGGASVALNQVWSFVQRLRGHPPAESLKADADLIRQRVANLERSDAEAAQRRRAIYQKIDEMGMSIRNELRRETSVLSEQVGELREGQTGLEHNNTHQNQHLAHIETKLDRLIERFLKTT